MNEIVLSEIGKNEPYSQKVYQQLKDLILTNQIKPGKVLNEREMAEQLQVSRTPVRDALRLLEQEGWITKQGKGKVVSLLTWKAVKDLLEIREPIELISYDLAVKRLADHDIQVLERLTEEMQDMSTRKKPASHYDLMKKDTDFHVYLALVTRNQRLIQIMTDLSDQLVRTSVLSVKYGKLAEWDYASQHLILLDCLKSRDYEAGRNAMIRHIEVWKEHLKDIPAIINADHEEDWIF